MEAADGAACRDSLESFRRGQASAIRRVVSALRDARAMAVDSTEIRPGVKRPDLSERIAEAIVGAFGFSDADRGFGLARTAEIKRDRAELRAKAERHRDAHRRAALALRSVHPARAALDARDAEAWGAIMAQADSITIDRIQTPSAYLDDLTIEIVAIFDHATTLARHHVLTEIAPGILAAAFECYPDCAPPRGAENPLARYKRAIKRKVARGLGPYAVALPWPARSEADPYLYHRRAHLFAGDGRFPVALFQRHKPSRHPPIRH